MREYSYTILDINVSRRERLPVTGRDLVDDGIAIERARTSNGKRLHRIARPAVRTQIPGSECGKPAMPTPAPNEIRPFLVLANKPIPDRPLNDICNLRGHGRSLRT